MLTIVRSPLPSIRCEPKSLPPEVSELLKRLEQRPQRCQWIVPTGRRKRALLREWLRTAHRPASLLPGLHTLNTFAAQVLEYSLKQLPQISGPERLLRVARAWQEVMGRCPGGGLVRQLDRFVRDWQACNMEVPSQPEDIFERVVQRYYTDLKSDQRLDQIGSLRVLLEEISDPGSWPNRLFLSRVDLLLFDGFHRLERLELELIAALAHRCDVLVWLVGIPGRPSWSVLESTVKLLGSRGTNPSVIDHAPAPENPFARLGRSSFSMEPVHSERSGPLPGLFKLEEADSALEVEAVAKRIKADYLAAQSTGRPLRLSDIAVVIPGPEYDPLIREIFPRAGLEFNLAGQALRVSSSRPARVLTAALQLVHGHWRHDLLFDFLNLPLVKRRLEEAHRLRDLLEHRPRARRQLDHRVWEASWRRQIQNLRDRIDRWRSGQLEIPEQTFLTREEYVAKQAESAGGLERLIQSIKTILRPVAALDGLTAKSGSMHELVGSCVELLQLVNIEDWLKPQRQSREENDKQYGVAVPWVEYEKDQKAYYKLLGILQTLPTLPENRLPLTPQGSLDVIAALQLALDSETYQIKTEDDAGVQLFELREIRGLRFRHVYALGLVHGRVPQLPEEGVLGNRRRRTAALAEQLQQKETEVTYLFSQLFEAAEELLVLACPTVDAHQKTMPSRFLIAVEEQVRLPPLEPAELTASLHEASRQLGRAAVGGQARGKALVDLWPRAALEKAVDLEQLVAGLASWQARESWPRRIRIEAPALLRILFADERVFSPSELETYAACPFRYFGARVLQLEERDPDRTRLLYGSLVHRVLQRFYTEKRQALGVSDGEPLPAVSGQDRTRLVQLFEAEWEQLDDGTLPPDLRNLFACEEGVLHLFFDAIASIEDEHGNLLNEFLLQDDQGEPILLGRDEHNRPVLLTGKIDRVDVHREERTRAIILDYKTGRGKPAKERTDKAADGRMLQLPLYAAALSLVRTELQVVGGAYIHLSEKLPDAKKAIAAAGALSTGGRSTPIPFETEAARRLALEFVGEIRDGHFSLTRHALGQPHAECTSYCEMKHACRHPDGYQAVNRY